MLCVSQASTAICSSMDEASSSSSSSTAQLGGRAIDRHNPIICDGRRSTAATSSSSSQPPIINPKPPKTKKVSALNNDQKRKSGATNSQAKIAEFFKADHHYVIGSKKKSSKKGGGDEFLVTPPGSSRYLLGDSAAFLDGVSADYNNRIDPVLALAPLGNKKTQVAKRDSSSSSAHQPKPPPSNQVVVLRVSLHCKGCEGKVRKHLSRMEGVTSFNIDFAAKKVTVVGDVTPVSVLASISKVKNAQIWSSAVSSVSASNPTLPTTQEANKN